MSDIQDEAYTELCTENERLRAANRQFSNEVASSEREIERLKALLTRAADALDGYGTKPWHQYRELIEELRKAAQ